MNTDVCIIGAGPAGLMAAIHCAAGRAGTALVESNTVAGRKLLLTGGGRCNITHNASIAYFIRAFGKGGRFLSYCLHKFPPERLLRFFADRGLDNRTEADGSIFPDTDRASDVRDILVAEAKKLGVAFVYGKTVRDIARAGGGFDVYTDKHTIRAGKLIVATGGLSYPATGSTGDGCRFAENLGHTIEPLRASLVPLVVREDFCAELAGTPVENVTISAVLDGRKVAATGHLVFTRDGIGGPAVLDMSRYLTDHLPAHQRHIPITIDLLGQVPLPDFEKQLLDRIAAGPKKTIAGILATFLPRRLAVVICEQLKCAVCPGSQLTKNTRIRLLESVKAFELSVVATRPIIEATVTRGGVRTAEIDPKTMQSRICPGLFFAGELIDVDGPCGGYNLQACFSTGAAAGVSAACQP